MSAYHFVSGDYSGSGHCIGGMSKIVKTGLYVPISFLRDCDNYSAF